MKTVLFILMSILYVQNTTSQIPSSCVVPPILRANYDADVTHLALQEIYGLNSTYSTYKDSIDVPSEVKDTIWSGLAAIYNLTSVIERDSVFDNYCIHNGHSYHLVNEIYVGLDSNCSWLTNWQNLNTTTGVASLDSLLSKYGFTVITFYSVGFNFAKLSTTQYINVKALCDSIETFNGVSYSEPKINPGFGNEINYANSGNSKTFDFVIGYGDCPSGCTASRIFKFVTYNDCSVNFLGIVAGGDPLAIMPGPINCNISTNIEKRDNKDSYKIYPNPADEFINIETIIAGNSSYQIINLFGQILQAGVFSNESMISIRDLCEGVYLIKIHNKKNNKELYYKFIK